MLAKNPRPQIRSIIKKTAGVLFVIEAVSFAGSYFVWSRLNTSRGEDCCCSAYIFFIISQMKIEITN